MFNLENKEAISKDNVIKWKIFSEHYEKLQILGISDEKGVGWSSRQQYL